MIQKVEYTTTKMHDSQMFEKLDTGDVSVLADAVAELCLRSKNLKKMNSNELIRIIFRLKIGAQTELRVVSNDCLLPEFGLSGYRR